MPSPNRSRGRDPQEEDLWKTKLNTKFDWISHFGEKNKDSTRKRRIINFGKNYKRKGHNQISRCSKEKIYIACGGKT